MRPHEHGAAAVLVTVALLVLIASASLAIDASLGYDERRDAQNAADNAAYAAAYEDCNPKDTAAPNPVNAAREVAKQNGFDNSDPAITVDAVENPLGSGVWTVKVTVSDIDSTFGGATPYAPDLLDVAATASARCAPDPFLGGYAVFAGADTCPQDELAISSADVVIDGDVHTNSDLAITGSSPTVNGDITYVPPGSPNPFSIDGQTPATTTLQDYPLDPALFFEYQPGGSKALGTDYYDLSAHGNVTNLDVVTEGHATGTNTTLEIIDSGIYYSAGNLTLRGVTLKAGVTVTFVALGTIDVEGDDDFVGYAPVDGDNPNSTSLLAFSWVTNPPTCSPGPANAINVSASSFDWTGLLFAPNGMVSFSTSGGSALDGSIIGYMVKLSGANLTVNYDDSANADPNYILELLR